MSRPLRIEWSSVDWKQGSVEIASQLGCCRDMVNRKRRELAPDTIKKPVSFEQVDWTTSNHDIALKLGCRTTYVAQMRHLWKIPGGKRKPGSGLYKQAWRKEQQA